jgi:hypothetical protein
MLKADAINQAYAQLRISGITVDVVPEEVELALRELDQMMSMWLSTGRDVNYNFPPGTTDYTETISDPADPLGIYAWAVTGVVASLAKQLVEYFGKPVPDAISAKARWGVNIIKQRTFRSIQQQYPHRMPIGSGQGRYADTYYRFYYPVYQGRAKPTPIIEGQAMNLNIDYNNDLKLDETVQTWTLEVTQGDLKIISSAIDDGVINYELQSTGMRDGKIESDVVTSEDRTFPRAYCFKQEGNTCVVTLDG